METYQLLAPLSFIIISLMVGAILKVVLKKTNSTIPYTVGLFAFGIIVGLLDRTGILSDNEILKSAIDSAGNADPDAILYIFLPILIFDAAYELDTHIFRKTLTNATLLSVPGVVIAMFLTAALVMGIFYLLPIETNWNWSFALMFGALISATDPVAVVALLKELGTSKRFSTLVDAESMLNDGTGIVLFMLFFGAYTTAGASSSPVADFMVVVFGGILTGLIAALLCIWVVTQIHKDELLQNSIIILSTYLTFFLAQSYFEVSGVIALVTFGLTIAHIGRPKLKPKVNHFMAEFWELAAYIANTLIFIIVGVIIALKSDATWWNFVILFALYIGVNIIRAIIVFLFLPIMRKSGYGLSIRESVILSWGGLRGALGLSLALMVSYTLPIPEDVRNQILFYTGGIVTLTLVINATTMKWLLEKLGLTKISSAKLLLDYSAKEQIRENSEKYLDSLTKREALADTNWDLVRTFMPQKSEKPDITTPTKDLVASLRLRVLDREKRLCWDLFIEGVISRSTFRRLGSTIDELYDKDGERPLTDRKTIYDFYNEPFYKSWLKKIRTIQNWRDRYFHDWVIAGYDLARGFIITQKEAMKIVNDFGESTTLSEEERINLQTLRLEIQKNIDRAQNRINLLAAEYPISYRCAVTRKAIRMLLNNERKVTEQITRQGLINEEDAQILLDDIDERYKEINTLYINIVLAKQEKFTNYSNNKM